MRETILRSDMSEELRKLLSVDAKLADQPIEKGQHATIQMKYDDGRVESWQGDLHADEARALKAAFPRAKTTTKRGRRPKAAAAPATT